ncbi:MAG TPA: thioredoxin [Candidatus Alistipes intestinipullorum]|nr:thioredoxin [Candidatus Alistipes intestinipullorum]
MVRTLTLLALLALGSCGQPVPRPAGVAEESTADRVEVLSFHAKRRCATCLAIEHLTHEVVASEFAGALADSSLLLRVVDISEEEALADRYEVAWSSLLLHGRIRGADTVIDLTRFAFDNARRNPEAFKSGLKAEIGKLLDIKQ